jgi:hypothetical protein
MTGNTKGSWDDLKAWPLIGLHAIVTQDGKVLTFGTDSRGMQGGQFIYDVYDPVTGTHQTLANTTPTDIFCSAAIILPGTDKILIGGGDRRPLGGTNKGVSDVNEFDSSDLSLEASAVGDMHFARWYPSMVSLPTGQIVILGGTDENGRGVSTPEIFTPGEGWRKLDGATDPDLGAASLYPRAFLNKDGQVIYFATARGNDSKIEVMSLDPSGNGSLTEIGTLPFAFSWDAPAIMYEAGKLLVMASNGDLWTMDINGPTPVFEKSASLSQDRNWSDLTVLADGSVLVNGGTSVGNKESGADKTAAIWNPDTGTITYGADEDQPRLYHSATVLLNDGTILSLGGGAAGSAENNYLDSQIYRPPYLYNEDGTLADRPVISGVPDSVKPGQTFTITADNAADIAKLTFVKSGAATHSFNMEARMVKLDFKLGPNNTIEVTLPENANEVSAGSWMLFACNKAGVPSVAPMISVEPTQPLFDGTGDLRAEFFSIPANVTSLDQIDFENADPAHVEQLDKLDYSGSGAYYTGGPADDFAMRATGDFNVTRDGSHTFYFTSDDGAELYIDGKLVIDNDGMQAATQKTVTLDLDAGLHKIEVRYFEGGGLGRLDLDWSGPGFNRKQMTFDGAVDNLLLNGSFEMGPSGSGTAPHGWAVEGAGGRLINATRASDGEASYTLGGWSTQYGNGGNAISQTVKTEAGLVYVLTFDISQPRGYDSVAAMLKVEALVAGGTNADFTQTLTGPFTSADKKYVTFTFTATSDSTTIKFTDMTSGSGADYDLDLDNVRLLPDAEANANDAPVAQDDSGTTKAGEALTLDVLVNDQDPDGDALSIASVTNPANGTVRIDNNGTVGDTSDDKIVYTPNSGFVGEDSFTYVLSDGKKITTATVTVNVTAKGIIVQDDPAETQYLGGTEHKDIFVINGVSSDYNWAPSDDGDGILVWNSAGFDILYDFEAIQFSDQTIDLTGDAVGQIRVQDSAGVEEYVSGTAGSDVFIINGKSTDYQWGPSDDGQGTMVWNEQGFDILYDFEMIQFTDKSVKLTGDGSEAMKVKDEAGTEEYIGGTAGNDVFVIDGASKDYNWAKSNDGTGILIWNDAGFDIVYDFEILRFNDTEIDLTDSNVGRTIVTDNPDEIEYVSGTDGKDVFVIDGTSSDWNFARTEDGNGIAVYNQSTNKVDFLYGFEEVTFNDQTVVIQDELA